MFFRLTYATTPTMTSSVRRLSMNSLKTKNTMAGQASRVLSSQASTGAAVTTPKPWGTPMVESAGDYRAEAWIEDQVGGDLYRYQKQLPRLPVPDIQQTLDRLLPTALPLAESPEEARKLQAAVDKFPQQAAVLQRRLEQRAADHPDSSWLQHWWNTLAYLDVRDSVVINVSYYFHFADDTTVYSGIGTADAVSPQIKRAAALLFTTAQVRNRVVTGTWPAETVGGRDRETATPLCSTAYKYLFHASRIPHHDTAETARDRYRIYDPASYTHAAVAVRGHLLRIPLVDETTHEAVALHVLEESLQRAVDLAHDAPPATGLTWCTAADRRAWAVTRDSLDEETLRQLETLESAACLVCLDEQSVHTTRTMAHTLLHGRPSTGDDDGKGGTPLNRWFDKSLQYVVTANGKAGMVGEHSMMDGMPVVTLADKLATTSYKSCRKQAGAVVPPSASFILDPHTTSLSPTTQEHIARAQQAFQEWVGQHEIHPKRFSAYGADWIKKQAGMSPDAFCQMAMQIATYRLWDGQQGATYEASQVRPFLHGRTETTRSVSPASAALVRRMGTRPLWHEAQDADARGEKLASLREAADAHVQYIRWAGAAQGVDRHLLGLLLSVQDGEAAPDLYADPLYQRAKTWRVSTSNLSHPQFVNWGYGEVTPMGVGLSYSIHPHHLQFSVTALKEHDWTERLGQHLEETLLELQMLVEADKTPQSKL